jgi:hypothetical protein
MTAYRTALTQRIDKINSAIDKELNRVSLGLPLRVAEVSQHLAALETCLSDLRYLMLKPE